MSLPKYKEINSNLSTLEIDEKIVNLHKVLFDLRVKKSLHKKIKTHLFTHIKRKISQLEFRKYQIKNLKFIKAI